jgi:hypothetical protein
MSDIATDFRSLVLAQAAIAAQVGTRVWVGQFPRNIDDALSAGEFTEFVKAILIVPGEGQTPGGAPVCEKQFELWCFGASSIEARGVADAVRGALQDRQRVTVNGRLWHGVWVEGDGVPRTLDPVGWEFVALLVQARTTA